MCLVSTGLAGKLYIGMAYDARHQHLPFWQVPSTEVPLMWMAPPLNGVPVS